MKITFIAGLLLLMVSYAIAQQFFTNKVDRVHATKIAAKLKFGMREEDAVKILERGSLTNSVRIGCSHGWNDCFILSDGCSLDLNISPSQARADGAWADGLLRSAAISSNSVKIISFTLTNAPQTNSTSSPHEIRP